MRLLYRYWSGQISVTEFKDVDVAVLTTTAEKKNFSIGNILAAASKLDVSTFKKFMANAEQHGTTSAERHSSQHDKSRAERQTAWQAPSRSGTTSAERNDTQNGTAR